MLKSIKCLLCFPSLAVETAYQQVKTSSNKSFFKLLILALACLFIISVVHSYLEGLTLVMIGFVVLILLCFILWKFTHRFEKCLGVLLFLLCLGFYIAGIFTLRNQSINSTCFETLFTGYYFGVFERLAVSKLPRLEYKILFSIAGLILRLTLFPIPNGITIAYQTVLLVIGFIVDIGGEKEERFVFKGFYDYKEELTKIKTLLVPGLPTGILILTRNIKQKLFANECLRRIFQLDIKIETSIQWLQHLIVEKESINLGQADKNDLQTNISFMKLLEMLNAKNFFKEEGQKLSCTAKYPNSTNSEPKILEIKVFALLWDGKEATAISLNDVTEQYANTSLKVIDANKDKMIAMVSHELRTPLNGILGMIHIMEKEAIDRQTLTYLSVCKNSGKLLLNIVNSILDLAQVKSNKIKLYITKGDIRAMLKEIYHLFELQFNEKGLSLEMDVGSEVPHSIMTDQNRLRQIIINLIGNAFKFTFQGGVRVSVRVRKDQREIISIKVSDTGIGIKDEDQKKLFNMYGKLDQPDAKTNKEGVGLGLTISDTLVKLLCANDKAAGIKVDSQYGKGTTFSFYIRNDFVDMNGTIDDFLEDIQDDSICTEGNQDVTLQVSSHNLTNTLQGNKVKLSARSVKSVRSVTTPLRGGKNFLSVDYCQSQQISTQNLNYPSSCASLSAQEDDRQISQRTEKGRIVIIDDTPFNNMVVKQLLESFGYQVKTATNGKIGIDLIKSLIQENKQIRAIFMDLQMPVMNGYEAAAILKDEMKAGNLPKIPIIALSANNGEEEMKKCKQIGMEDYLVKPLKETTLKRILKANHI